jgi:hypothetical protein
MNDDGIEKVKYLEITFDNINDNNYKNNYLSSTSMNNIDMNNLLVVNQEDKKIRLVSSPACVVETCAAYSNDSCLPVTSNKCVPTQEGCRCALQVFHIYILYIYILEWEIVLHIIMLGMD